MSALFNALELFFRFDLASLLVFISELSCDGVLLEPPEPERVELPASWYLIRARSGLFAAAAVEAVSAEDTVRTKEDLVPPCVFFRRLPELPRELPEEFSRDGPADVVAATAPRSNDVDLRSTPDMAAGLPEQRPR